MSSARLAVHLRRLRRSTRVWGDSPLRKLALVCGAALAVTWLVGAAAQLALPRAGVSEAYIGPGAGIALLGSCLTVLMAMFLGALYIIIWPFRLLWRLIRGQRAMKHAKVNRVVIIGLDGLEPTLAEPMLEAGKLPNLARLRAAGSYQRLGTTWPPLSPVAWSSFSTGTNPGKHNIFDFIARTADYRPMMSSVRIREPRRKLKLAKWLIPLSAPEVTALRKSRPFWSVLGDKGIFSAILRVPITFPPDKFRGVQLSAMCVPDLRGTQGMFSYYVEQGETGQTTEGDVGGDRIRVARDGAIVRSYLRGPANSLRSDGHELRAPFTIRAGSGAAAALEIDGQTVSLPRGGYTEWVRVSFRAAPGVKVRGICRFFLKRFEAPFEMYCTPLQIDPDKPVMPIAQPSYYSSYLARRQGSFSTLGLAEDTWSLSEKMLDEDAFLTQAYDIHAEREKMLFDALRTVRQGVVTCVFDGPDRIQHMFWRFIDDRHPALANGQRAAHRHVIGDMYEKMDALIGRVTAALRPGDALIVMSDHGFKPFRRGVDLNAWLRDQGYLRLRDGKRVSERSYLADIDWSQTRAYAVGLAGLFINQKGRELHGTVEPGADARRLIDEIAGKLTGMQDAADGEIAVKEAIPAARAYKGPYTENAPDVIVGYGVGYRVSWDAAIGKCGEAVISDNLKAWSGDHCVHPQLVPGVLFSNLKLGPRAANIIDLAPTVLDLFGVPRPGYIDGESLLAPAGGAR